MNNAIIGVAREGHFFELGDIARRVDAGPEMQDADYKLNFTSAAQLFSELTPARLALLEALKQSGAQSIYALAKRLERNYSNVHRDVRRLLDLDLVNNRADGLAYVPWDEVEIHLSLRSAA